ncbi:MAG: hypothetical protein ACLTLW_02190, partial [Sutterella wadsworthensis]
MFSDRLGLFLAAAHQSLLLFDAGGSEPVPATARARPHVLRHSLLSYHLTIVNIVRKEKKKPKNAFSRASEMTAAKKNAPARFEGSVFV